jgi:hypothetical protein
MPLRRRDPSGGERDGIDEGGVSRAADQRRRVFNRRAPCLLSTVLAARWTGCDKVSLADPALTATTNFARTARGIAPDQARRTP